MIVLLLGSCSTKEQIDEFLMEYRYSNVEELLDALITIDSLCHEHSVLAYLDTLPDGRPDPLGEAIPLTEFIGNIRENENFYLHDCAFILNEYQMTRHCNIQEPIII